MAAARFDCDDNLTFPGPFSLHALRPLMST